MLFSRLRLSNFKFEFFFKQTDNKLSTAKGAAGSAARTASDTAGAASQYAADTAQYAADTANAAAAKAMKARTVPSQSSALICGTITLQALVPLGTDVGAATRATAGTLFELGRCARGS